MRTALLLAAALQAAPVTYADAPDLVVQVENVPDDRGLVHVDVCGPEGFLGGGECLRTVVVPAHAGTTAVHVPGVPPGDWAVQAFHDRDENGAVTRNRLGIPTEAFGFSRSPALGLRGPKFTAAAFTHGPQAQTVAVKLRRLF